jgi:hypothetical protein
VVVAAVTPVTSVKVVGASLADSGTFGFKFTVQPKETYKGNLLFSGADFSAMLATLLTPTQISDNAGDPETLGTLYMQALADKLLAAVNTNALDKGAKRVANVAI